MKPTALVKIDSTDEDVSAANLAALELILYGSPGIAPRLPLPDEVDSIMGTGITEVTPDPLAYTAGTHTIEYVPQAGVQYYRTDTGVEILADVILGVGQSLVVEARPAATYNFPETPTYVTVWAYDY
jgi:hypothetical protein